MSLQTRSLRLSEGAAYKLGLYYRHVDISRTIIESFKKPDFLENTAHPVFIPECDRGSCNHAVALTTTAANESTFCLVMPFLITEWLVHVENLKFFVSVQWKMEQLESYEDSARPLSMPKPDLTIAFEWRSLLPYKFPLPASVLPKDMFPIPGDLDTGPAFFTVEAKFSDMEEACLQSLHTAALMLCGLRNLFERCYGSAEDFDDKVRVLTANITCNQVNVYGHWTRRHPESGGVWYEHFLIYSCFLYDQNSLYMARIGLERLCQWIAKDTEAWIVPGVKRMRIGSRIAGV